MTVCKRHIKIVSLFFLLLLLATACNTISVISLNVKVPARVVFPKYVDNIVVVNNAGFQPNDEGHTFYMDAVEKRIDIETDSLSTLMCRILSENIANQNFFSEVGFYDIPLRDNDEYLFFESLSASKINDIVEQTQADAIISLDYFYVKSFLSVKKILAFDVFEAACEISIQMQPTIYIPGETGKSLSLVDTVFWESYGTTPNEAVTGLPYLDDALTVAIERMGEIAVKAIVPHKQIEKRQYYSSLSGDMKKAGEAVDVNDWDKALDIWLSVYQKSNKLSVRARCAANIALAYELRDDYSEAEEWAVQSQKEFAASGSASDIDQIRYIKSYITRLKQRKIESALLDRQE